MASGEPGRHEALVLAREHALLEVGDCPPGPATAAFWMLSALRARTKAPYENNFCYGKREGRLSARGRPGPWRRSVKSMWTSRRLWKMNDVLLRPKWSAAAPARYGATRLSLRSTAQPLYARGLIIFSGCFLR